MAELGVYVCMGLLNFPAPLALCVWWSSNVQRSETRSSFCEGFRLGGERLEKKCGWCLGWASAYLDY